MMKQMLNPVSNNGARDFMLLLIRFTAGLLLIISHGFPKFQMLTSGEPVQFVTFLGMSASTCLALSMFAELICASFIILGLFTRFAVIPLIINFSVVVFHIHASDPLIVKELPIMYLVSFIVILFSGPGKHSLDTLIHRKVFKTKALAV